MFSYRTCSPYHLLSGLAKKCSPSGRKHWVCGPCLFLMISWTLDTWIPTYCFKIRKIHSNCKYLLFNYYFSLGCNTAILYHLLQKSTSTLNLKHMYIVQCTIYNTKCRNAHCKKNLLIILVHPTSFISWVSFYFTNIHESHNKSYRVWEKKFESSNTPHIHVKLTFSWPNYFNFHFD